MLGDQVLLSNRGVTSHTSVLQYPEGPAWSPGTLVLSALPPHAFPGRVIYLSCSLCEVVQASCAPIMACYGSLARHPALWNISPPARASAWRPSPAPAAHVSLCSASRLVFPSVNPTLSNHFPRRAGKWGLGWEEKGPPTAAVCLTKGKAGGTWADGPPPPPAAWWEPHSAPPPSATCQLQELQEASSSKEVLDTICASDFGEPLGSSTHLRVPSFRLLAWC